MENAVLCSEMLFCKPQQRAKHSSYRGACFAIVFFFCWQAEKSYFFIMWQALHTHDILLLYVRNLQHIFIHFPKKYFFV
jgi:hypothetical protein